MIEFFTIPFTKPPTHMRKHYSRQYVDLLKQMVIRHLSSYRYTLNTFK